LDRKRGVKIDLRQRRQRSGRTATLSRNNQYSSIPELCRILDYAHRYGKLRKTADSKTVARNLPRTLAARDYGYKTTCARQVSAQNRTDGSRAENRKIRPHLISRSRHRTSRQD
jgi:hypothetical protein